MIQQYVKVTTPYIKLFQGEPDHLGTRFILGFMENNSTVPPEVLVIPQSTQTVNVTIRLPLQQGLLDVTTLIHRENVSSITLPISSRMSRDKVGSKGKWERMRPLSSCK